MSTQDTEVSGVHGGASVVILCHDEEDSTASEDIGKECVSITADTLVEMERT